MTDTMAEPKVGIALVFRFVAFGILMAFANILPYLLTQGDYATDGLETAGWPVRCYEFGGLDGHVVFSPWAMAANIVIAIVISALAAWLFRNGIRKTLRRWQTWGTPHAT